MKCLCFLILIALACAPVCADNNAPVITTLPDGLRIICRQEPSSNLVAITVFVQAGSAEENLQDAGIGSMVADSILGGTSNQDTDTMTMSIGEVGGNVTAIWEPDETQLRALVLPSQFGEAAYLLSDVVKNADFPASSVQNARDDLLSRIQQRSDDVFDSTDDQLRGTLYAGTAYALPQIGTPQTIKRLTVADLSVYFQRFYRPDNMLISVVGNVDPHVVATTFGGDLSDFYRPKTHHVPPFVVPAPPNGTQSIVVKSYRGDVVAGLMMAGFLAPGVDSPDYPAMSVANALLGGMKTSLMFKNLRLKKQYGYEVASTYTAQLGVSDVTGYILYSLHSAGQNSSNVDQTAVVKQALIDQFKQLGAAPPSDDDLARAKKYVIGSYLLSHERIEDRSYYLGYSELAIKQFGGYHFDDNYADAINAVTAADIQRVALKWFSGPPVISLLLPGDPSAGVQNE
jgi:predicted Zn-dependent peptidase